MKVCKPPSRQKVWRYQRGHHQHNPEQQRKSTVLQKVKHLTLIQQECCARIQITFDMRRPTNISCFTPINVIHSTSFSPHVQLAVFINRCQNKHLPSAILCVRGSCLSAGERCWPTRSDHGVVRSQRSCRSQRRSQPPVGCSHQT